MEMAKQIKTIDYDLEEDILFISNGEKVKASLDIGDFILDVNHNNLICGIEIMDASVNLGIDKETLNEIKSIKMSVTYKTNHAYLLIMLSFKKGHKEVNMPIPLTINLGHKTPRKDVLVYN
ncbi:MAG TPA: DUF2283 domain-containing protein [Candidatus Pacearchaeota archaeon]|nr:DUF2283 domain-containing protein [Candidatus Pacearchaeota archaeon]